MGRKELPIQLPIRFFQRADIDKPFRNEILTQLGIDLSNFKGKNVKNQYVLVYSHDNGSAENIAALIEFNDPGTHFYVGLVVSNRDYDGVPSAGTFMLDQMNTISTHFGYKKIVLDALEKKVPYYESLGYVRTGKVDTHAILGLLVGMERRL